MYNLRHEGYVIAKINLQQIQSFKLTLFWRGSVKSSPTELVDFWNGDTEYNRLIGIS